VLALWAAFVFGVARCAHVAWRMHGNGGCYDRDRDRS
jgi:hypothetical protein